MCWESDGLGLEMEVEVEDESWVGGGVLLVMKVVVE